jgi:hypothetical protein
METASESPARFRSIRICRTRHGPHRGARQFRATLGITHDELTAGPYPSAGTFHADWADMLCEHCFFPVRAHCDDVDRLHSCLCAYVPSDLHQRRGFTRTQGLRIEPQARLCRGSGRGRGVGVGTTSSPAIASGYQQGKGANQHEKEGKARHESPGKGPDTHIISPILAWTACERRRPRRRPCL